MFSKHARQGPEPWPLHQMHMSPDAIRSSRSVLGRGHAKPALVWCGLCRDSAADQKAARRAVMIAENNICIGGYLRACGSDFAGWMRCLDVNSPAVSHMPSYGCHDNFPCDWQRQRGWKQAVMIPENPVASGMQEQMQGSIDEGTDGRRYVSRAACRDGRGARLFFLRLRGGY